MGKSSLGSTPFMRKGSGRYVESLSAYARQFLERMEKPDVDEISGISPAVAIGRKEFHANPRSTVATHGDLRLSRLLFARCGQTFCVKCGARFERTTRTRLQTRVLSLAPGRRFYVLHLFRIAAPVSTAVSNAPRKKTAAAPRRTRFARPARSAETRFQPAIQAGRIHEFSSPETLLIGFLEAGLCACGPASVNAESRSRLVDSIEICYREGQGEAPSGIYRGRRRKPCQAADVQRTIRMQE